MWDDWAKNSVRHRGEPIFNIIQLSILLSYVVHGFKCSLASESFMLPTDMATCVLRSKEMTFYCRSSPVVFCNGKLEKRHPSWSLFSSLAMLVMFFCPIKKW